MVVGIGVLGPLTVDGRVDGGVGLARRDRLVLAALAVFTGDPLSQERLAEAVWGDRPPASWRKVLHGCVARLRKVLGPQAIETVSQGYRLVVGVDDVDARRFERLVARARELLSLGEADRAMYVVGEALELWRGPALVDLERWELARIEAGRLEELRLEAEELRLDAALRAGRHLEVLAEAHARVAEAPLRERRWALQALAQYQAGRQGEALASLRRVRTVLSAELGLDPGPELVAVEQAILRHDPSLLIGGTPPEPSAGCPYLGLAPYDVADAEAFFGRVIDVRACLHRLGAVGVVAVVGASGSGKSSLVRAGLVAALRREGRPVVVVSPGKHPMEALTTVPSSGAVPVLVVDQCEEVLALCKDPAERARFFAALAEHADRGPLVVAVRADRFGELSAEPRLARLVERGLHLLGAMGEDELREAIEGPARQAGLLVEPGLVDLLVQEVEGNPGALPLLSHALRQTWQRREGRTLTVAGYRASGGIRGAVATTAEELVARLPAEQWPLLRDLLLRLVAPTADGEPVRSRVPRRLVATGPQQERLIEALVAARLVTSDDGVVELAHEAVVRAWPRLRGWLDDDADGQRILRHLSVAADTWQAMGRPESELYRGIRLARALDWQQHDEPDLTPVERAFLEFGGRLAAAERDSVERRARDQARTNRRLRTLLGAATVLLLLAATAGVLAVQQAGRAAIAATAAEARRIGAQALAAPGMDQALLLAVQGVRLDDSRDTRANLLAVLSRSPQLIGVIRGQAGHVLLSVSPDGTIVAAADEFNRTWFYNTSTHAVVHQLGPETRQSRLGWRTGKVAFRPGGGQIAVIQPDQQSAPVRLLDAATFADTPTQPGGLPAKALPWNVSYSPDGRLLAATMDYDEAGTTHSSLMIWDLAGVEQPIARISVPPFTHSLVFSPDGRLLYTGTQSTPAFAPASAVTVYDVATRRSVGRLEMPSFPLALSPDGRLLATASSAPRGGDSGEGRDVVLFDAATGRQQGRLTGHTGQVQGLAFSHGGGLLASTSADRTVTVWTVATGERRETLNGHASGVWGVAFAPDDATLYTTGPEGAILIWDLRGDHRFAPRLAVVDPVRDLQSPGRAAPTGRAVAYASEDTDTAGQSRTWLRILDLDTGRTGPLIDTRHGHSLGPVWRPDGARLASTGTDGYVRTWDPHTGEMIDEQRVADGGAAAVAFTGDGRRLIVGALDGVLHQVDADTLQQTGQPTSVNGEIWLVAASPDNRTALTLSTDPAVTPSENYYPPTNRFALVDLTTSKILHSGTIAVDATSAAFSPDGHDIAIAGRDGEVLILDVDSGRPLRSPVDAHDGEAGPLAYAPDNATIVAGGADGRVSLWDAHTGDLLGTFLPGRSDTGTQPAFLPDGHTVLIPAWDGTIHTWDTNPDRWITFACTVAGRNLTADEWAQTIGKRRYQPTCT